MTRGDDLESLGYTFLFLRSGLLLWDDQRWDATLRTKKNIATSELCRGLPRELVEYFDNVKDHGCSHGSVYSKLREVFRKTFERRPYDDDGLFK